MLRYMNYRKVSPVYPCAYREHVIRGLLLFLISGLSLCIQGTSMIESHALSFVRFIPVHTGNIVVNGKFDGKTTVYPCAYREHVYSMYMFVNDRGLSLCIQGTYQL